MVESENRFRFLNVKKELFPSPGLKEISNEITVTQENDYNGHLNHADYFPLYEDQRHIYLKNIGFGQEVFRRMEIRAVMIDLGSSFRKEIFNGDRLTIYTCAEPVKDICIRFGQRAIKDGTVAALLACTYYLVKDNVGIQRLPSEMVEKLNQFNT